MLPTKQLDRGVPIAPNATALADSLAAAPAKNRPYLRETQVAETILLAEDDELVRSLASQVLHLEGYRVLEASDGEVALALADHYPGPIHLLVADLVMPRLGGRTLADRLLSANPRLKVLLMSGYTFHPALDPIGSEAPFAFLQKPFSTAAFATKVREILDSPA